MSVVAPDASEGESVITRWEPGVSHETEEGKALLLRMIEKVGTGELVLVESHIPVLFSHDFAWIHDRTCVLDNAQGVLYGFRVNQGIPFAVVEIVECAGYAWTYAQLRNRAGLPLLLTVPVTKVSEIVNLETKDFIPLVSTVIFQENFPDLLIQ